MQVEHAGQNRAKRMVALFAAGFLAVSLLPMSFMASPAHAEDSAQSDSPQSAAAAERSAAQQSEEGAAAPASAAAAQQDFVSGDPVAAVPEPAREAGAAAPGQIAPQLQTTDPPNIVTSDTSWYNTTSTTFTLSNAAQLKGFADIVNGVAAGIAQDNFAGKTVIQGADIVLEADGRYAVAYPDPAEGHSLVYFTYYDVLQGSAFIWTPIGEGAAFAGTYDGGNKTIKGLYTDRARTNQGLFGRVTGTVQNVRVASGLITGSEAVAAVVARLEAGTVQNCSNAALVYGSGAVGGIVGEATVIVGACPTIAECTNSETVTGTGLQASAGGIVGRISAALPSDISVMSIPLGYVRDCLNSAVVGSDYSAGGIVGGNFSNSMRISSSVNKASAVVRCSGIGYAAGIAGQSAGIISDCYNRGNCDIGLYNNGEAYLAGIVARLEASVRIESCYSTSYNTLSLDTPLVVPAATFIGKLVGAGGYGDDTGNTNILSSYYLAETPNAASQRAEVNYPVTDVSLGWLRPGSGKTAVGLKNYLVLASLGPVYNFDAEGAAALNNGYPVLTWQGGVALGPVGTGDIDGDGSITSEDILGTARYAVYGFCFGVDDPEGTSSIKISQAQFAAMDMDGDGVITMADAVRILRKSLGL